MPGYVVSPETGRKPSEKLWDWFKSRHKWNSNMLDFPLRVRGVLREVLYLARRCYHRKVHQDHIPQPSQLWPESRRYHDGPPYEQGAYSKRYKSWQKIITDLLTLNFLDQFQKLFKVLDAHRLSKRSMQELMGDMNLDENVEKYAVYRMSLKWKEVPEEVRWKFSSTTWSQTKYPLVDNLTWLGL